MYDSSSVEEQLQHLQEKKKRIQSTIDELLDAARKAGIEPGDLR
jgi:ferritin